MALRYDSAAAVVGTVVLGISALDIWLIRSKRTSISRHVGSYARRHPVRFWTAWIALGLHLAVELPYDPLSWLGGRLRRGQI